MRYYEVPPKMLNELRDLVASPTGDITKIRNQIKEIVEYQKNMK
jgi:Spy/CpxP family protein refolding chaperone